MRGMRILNNALSKIVNAERRGTATTQLHPVSKVMADFLGVMKKRGNFEIRILKSTNLDLVMVYEEQAGWLYIFSILTLDLLYSKCKKKSLDSGYFFIPQLHLFKVSNIFDLDYCFQFIVMFLCLC